MVSPEVIGWIKAQKVAGYNDEQLRTSLLQKGHSQKDVNDAFMQIKKEEVMGKKRLLPDTTLQNPIPTQTVSSSPTPVQNNSLNSTQKDNLSPSKEIPKEAMGKEENKEAPKEAMGKEENKEAPKKEQISPEEKKESEVKSTEGVKKTNFSPLIIIGVVLILIVGAGAYYYFNVYSPSSGPKFTQALNNNNNEDLLSCELLSQKLKDCEQFTCEFNHPIMGGIMTREITGFIGEDCKYIEEMPNNGIMTCLYNSEYRMEVSKYYRDYFAPESETPEEVTIIPIYTIDGKDVKNPLQEAMDTGVCVIEGYE